MHDKNLRQQPGEVQRPPDDPSTTLGAALDNGWSSISRNAWKVTLLSLGGWALVSVDTALWAVNYPLIAEEFDISDNMIGVIYAFIYAAGALATFAAGPLMDRIGRKPVYQLCLFAAILGSVLTAGAPGIIILIIARCVTQAGAQAEWMAGQVLVAEEAPARFRGRLIGLAQIGYPLGFFFAGLLSFAIVPLLGWRWVFACGVLPIIMMLWARRAIKESAHFTEMTAKTTKEERGRIRDLFAPGLRRTTILITVWSLFQTLAFGGLASYMPTIFERFGVSLDKLYLANIIATGVAGFGYFACASVGEWIGRREAAAIWLILGAAGGVFMATEGRTFVTLTIGYSLFYFFGVAHISAAIGFVAESFPTRLRGSGTNFATAAQMIGFMFAGLTGPMLLNSVGVVASMWIWLVVFQLIAAFALLGMKRIRPGTELADVEMPG
ncbi:MFS transporter [Rhodococcus koreensis]|uniref:MFS transporter n=1 Tax=Rhodococcus koreensis TaxID=99653 RepID=UPI00197CFE4F|nr:MFS transporter [Rhodococcus koreensis]QSE86079.1 MFS transporter [Rhodococcus koreensis]